MTERETPESEPDDGLDAWLAAHFPPKPEETKPEPPPVPPVDQGLPGAPAASELIDPSPIAPPPFTPDPTGAPTMAWSAPPPGEPPFPPVVDAALPGLPEPGLPESPTEVFGAVGDTSVLDDLFGETKFREYGAGPDPAESPFATKTVAITAPDAAVRRPPSEGFSKTQKVLLWVGGSLVAVLALVALFLIGTKLSDLLGPAPAVVAPTSASPTPSPTPTVAAVGPVEPGDYRWDDLLGGECLDPYPGPWAEEFTVVDCAGPHPAQVVAQGTFAGAAATAPDPSASPSAEAPESVYPGAAALQSQINLLCTAPTVIDYAAAGKYTDIQFEASYPATDQQWADGDREYYCFVSRTSGEPITGTIAVPQAAPAP